MDALATDVDVALRFGRDLTDDEKPRINTLLLDASARVRREAGGQLITKQTTTVRLPVRRGQIDLPQYPVVAVTAVKNDAGSDITVQWSAPSSWIYVGSVDRFDLEPFYGSQYGNQYLNVTYTHGYDPIPDEIVGLVCQMAGRAFGVSPESAAVTSETLGAYSYAIGGAAAAGGFGMLRDEIVVARGYRKPTRPLLML